MLFLLSQMAFGQVEKEKHPPHKKESVYIITESVPVEQVPEEYLIFTERKNKHHHKKTRIKLHGQIDAQYNFNTTKDYRNLITKEDFLSDDPAYYNFLGVPPKIKDYASFQVRRARLGAEAYFRYGWSAHVGIALDMGNPNTEYTNRRDYLDYAYAQKHFKYGWIHGDLYLGYKKVKFGMEERTLPFDLLTVERSIATNYFNGATMWDYYDGRPSGYVCTPLGIGNRHTGIQWEGKLDNLLEGLNYYVALTNEVYNPFQRPKGQTANRISYYGGLGFDHKSRYYDMSFGVNYVYSPRGIMYFPIEEQGTHQLYAFNPYFMARAGWLSITSEVFLGHAEHGQFIQGGFYDEGAPGRAENAPDAKSIGINAMVGVQVTDWIQPYFRYSYLNSGGAGFSSGYLKDVLPNANAPFENNNFDKGDGYSAGVNITLVPKKVRFSMEWSAHNFIDDLNYRIFINNPYTHDRISNEYANELLEDSRMHITSLRARLQIKF